MSWGAQARGRNRPGENDENYSLGDACSLAIWAARRWSDGFSTSTRRIGEETGDIDGADARLNPALVPTAVPCLRVSERFDLGLGRDFDAPFGPAVGMRLTIEASALVCQ